MIEFQVPGVPQQQGSKTRWGTEENENVRSWRESVAHTGTAVMRGAPLYDGPIRLSITFIFPRPKSHYRTGKYKGELRQSAPIHHTGPPDLDKLMRAIGDALTGVVIRDDRQIAQWHARKIYGAHPGMTLRIETLVPQLTQLETPA